MIIYTPIKLLLGYLNKNPSYRLSKSDILRFADPRLENKVRVNGINLTKGKQNLFELARSSS